MTIREAYNEAKERLKRAGVESPAFDAACLLEKAVGIRRHELPLKGDQPADARFDRFWADVARRESREPLQYILGEWEFMGLPFDVGEGVLVPRPDTELLAQTGIDFLSKIPHPRMLELCGGSGCISVAAANALPGCIVDCLELSETAISYIKRNAVKNGMEGRVRPLQGDMLIPQTEGLFEARSFDALLCNPPYIPAEVIETLEPEVRCHEPRLALDGGSDGLRFYRAALGWFDLLRPGGLAAFEVGKGQADEVAALFRQALGDVFILKDYGGIQRVVGGFSR